MNLMNGDDDNFGNKPQDEISDLLKNFYKPNKEINVEEYWKKISGNIESLFHAEMFSDKIIKYGSSKYSDEERYWLGLEEYLNNEITAIKHKMITNHLLDCSACRQNFNKLMDKKKEVLSV